MSFNYKIAADLQSGRPVSAENTTQFVLNARWTHEDRDSLSQVIADLRREIAAREGEIALLKTLLLEQEAEGLEQSRLLGMGGEREASLLACNEALERELAACYETIDKNWVTHQQLAGSNKLQQERDNFAAAGHRMALELECLLADTKDNVAKSRWWDSGHAALGDWQKLFVYSGPRLGD